VLGLPCSPLWAYHAGETVDTIVIFAGRAFVFSAKHGPLNCLCMPAATAITLFHVRINLELSRLYMSIPTGTSPN